MTNYTDVEKQQIMLMSDLLNTSITSDEKKQLIQAFGTTNQIIDVNHLENFPLNSHLQRKVTDLLGQGMKLGIQLNQLSQKGVKILFPSQIHLPNALLQLFDSHPTVLFTIGRLNIVSKKDVKYIMTYADLEKCNKMDHIIFFADRNFDTLLCYSEIGKRLMNGNLLLISDTYHSKSTVKESSYKEQTRMKKNVNKKVFISGSRSQVEIPKNVQSSLELISKQNIEILIGDSEKGVDNEIIDYFRFSPLYPLVKIFTIKQKPRVKVENEWKTLMIETDPTLKPQEKQMVKDRAMADEADWGLAIFKPITLNRYKAIQVSAGTLRNSIQLLLNKKAVKLFYLFENEIHSKDLKSIADLKEVIEQYKYEKLSPTEIETVLTAKGVNTGENPVLVKYNKINKKFLELLKKEENILRHTARLQGNDSSIEQLSLFR